MSETEKKNSNIFMRILRYIYISYIPNNRDNIKQILVKLLFLVCVISLIVSSTYIADYFLTADKQNDIIDDSREIWHNTQEFTEPESEEEPPVISEAEAALLKENPDFKGWIRISNTKVDNPIYQTTNNSYYLNHNQNKKSSAYGALYFDYKNKITEEETDKNLIIYGHEMKNGSMFGNLKKFKNLKFYKENPTIEFSTLYKDSVYKIYSIFILNADKADDGGYIYNIYRQKFIDSADFNDWIYEAQDRSVINTGVDVQYGDNIITLVTCSNDFKNSRLIVMAREVREGESNMVDTSVAVINPEPRYPEKWYTTRGMKK